MTYDSVVEGTFLSRPNRFIAHVQMDGQKQICHVKNTGRCRELLVPGATVFLQRAQNPERKTQFDLIAVQKGERIINMDSQAPNRVLAQWLERTDCFGGISLIRPESRYRSSRFDFYVESDMGMFFIEAKGVTLEQDGVALFPDAPTQRGVKHLRELMDCLNHGYRACVAFVIQMEDIRHFTPNAATHPEFAQVLWEARQAGVQLLALGCRVTPNSLDICCQVPIHLPFGEEGWV